MSRTRQIRALIYSRQEPVFVDVPGFVDTEVDSGRIACRILSDDQILESRIAAYAFLTEEAKLAGVPLAALLDADPDVYERERIHQMIHLAFVEWPVEDEPKLVFTEPHLIRSLDSVMVQALLEAYLAVQDTKGVQKDFRDEDLDELLERLRAPRGEGALAMLSSTGLRSLLMAIARRHQPAADLTLAPASATPPDAGTEA